MFMRCRTNQRYNYEPIKHADVNPVRRITAYTVVTLMMNIKLTWMSTAYLQMNM